MPFGPSFPFILASWAFISFHFGLLGFHFLSFWPFGPSFPFILAFWAFICFHFGLFGLHFLSFWPFGVSFPFILAFWAFISFHFLLAGAATWGPPRKLPKTVRFLIKFKQILSAARPAALCNLWHFWHFLSFWLFEATGGVSFASSGLCPWGANFASRYSVVHAMRILPRNLQRFALAFQLRFYVPFVAVFWPLLFEGTVSTVKNKVF